jgi:hypothetical protein
MPSQIINDPFSIPLIQYPIALIDYLWVIIIYISSAFILAAIIDGYILPIFDKEKVSYESSPWLVFQILLQFAIQGFIAILLSILLQKAPSPVHGIFGYESQSSMGLLLRNPAIIYIILFALSKSLQAKLFILFGRVSPNVNANVGIPVAILINKNRS